MANHGGPVRDIRLDMTRNEYTQLVNNTRALMDIYQKALQKVDNRKQEVVDGLHENFDSVEGFYNLLGTDGRIKVLEDPK